MQRWIHLQRFVADTLRMSFDKWIEEYVGPCMEKPFDYSFLQDTIPGLQGGLNTDGVSFSKDIDPATALTARVPLRAQNNLGRLSPNLQDQVAALLSSGESAAHKLSPADLTQLQKIFPQEKALARLKRKDFRKTQVVREADDILINVEGGEAILKLNVLEFSAVMNKALL